MRAPLAEAGAGRLRLRGEIARAGRAGGAALLRPRRGAARALRRARGRACSGNSTTARLARRSAWRVCALGMESALKLALLFACLHDSM
jgi:hypothetical protein